MSSCMDPERKSGFAAEVNIPENIFLSAASTAMSVKQKLVSAFREVERGLGSGEVTVRAFIEYFSNEECTSKKKRQGIKSVLSEQYIAALFEIFKVENRDDVSYLTLAQTTQPELEMTISSTTASSRKCGLPRSNLRRIRRKNLVTPSDLGIRVTECLHAEEYVLIHFNLKKDENEVLRVHQDLNDKEFVWSNGVPLCYPGLVCAAPDAAEQDYCRIVVLKHLEGEDDCFVQFLDFGKKDYVKKSSLRKLPNKWLNKPALSYKALVVNSPQCRHRREQLAYDMLQSDVILVRMLRFNKDKKCYEVHANMSSDFDDEDVGFCAG